jgi:hypothetical protein
MQRALQDQDRENAGKDWHSLDLVFASTVGTALDAANVRRVFRRITKAAGLNPTALCSTYRARLTDEACGSVLSHCSASVGVRRVPLPVRGDRGAERWYMRYGLSYRDVEEQLAERAVEVDHVTVYRWVQRFMPLLADAARFARHSPGDRWLVDETSGKVNGLWRYVYRAIDQHGQVIDVLLSTRWDAAAARRFFIHALRMLNVVPHAVVTDAAPVYPCILEELGSRARYRSPIVEPRL